MSGLCHHTTLETHLSYIPGLPETYKLLDFGGISPDKNSYLENKLLRTEPILSWLLDSFPACMLPTKHPYSVQKSLKHCTSCIEIQLIQGRNIMYAVIIWIQKEGCWISPIQATPQTCLTRIKEGKYLLIFAFFPSPHKSWSPNC